MKVAFVIHRDLCFPSANVEHSILLLQSLLKINVMILGLGSSIYIVIAHRLEPPIKISYKSMHHSSLFFTCQYLNDGSTRMTDWHKLPVSAGQITGGSSTLHRGTYVSPTDDLKYNQVHGLLYSREVTVMVHTSLWSARSS